MLEYIEGNLFESPAQVIVNTVNTVGVMGKGIALAFKKRYPAMFEQYKAACDRHALEIGKLMLYYADDYWVLLFPTKKNWRNPSKLEYIEQGLQKFVASYAEKHITSVAFPRLGCGNGALDWNEVKPLMEKYLKGLPIPVYIYIGENPDLPPEHQNVQQTLEWLREHAKDMSFAGVYDDLRAVSSDGPYSFMHDDVSWEMRCGQELSFTSAALGGKLVRMPVKKLEETWDRLKTRGVLRPAAMQEGLLCSVLLSLHYLSPVRVWDAEQRAMVAGYQLNEGIGRVKRYV
ncbi:MAG: macro domain-containing protein [Akkermansia sp.]